MAQNNYKIVALGKTITLLDVSSPLGVDEEIVYFNIESEAFLASLYVSSIIGTFNAYIETLDGNNNAVRVLTFPEITTTTASLLIRKAATTLNKCRLVVSYTGAADFHINIRGVTQGEASSVTITGSGNAKASKTTASTVASQIIPTSLADRSGVAIKNYNLESGVLYVGFSEAESAVDVGWPLDPGEVLTMDVGAGVAVWATSNIDDLDVRILEGSS